MPDPMLGIEDRMVNRINEISGLLKFTIYSDKKNKEKHELFKVTLTSMKKI